MRKTQPKQQPIQPPPQPQPQPEAENKQDEWSAIETISKNDDYTQYEPGYVYKKGDRNMLFNSDSEDFHLDNREMRKNGRKNKYFMAVEEEDESDPDNYDNAHILPTQIVRSNRFAPDQHKHRHRNLDNVSPVVTGPRKDHKYLKPLDQDSSSESEEDFPESSIAVKRKELIKQRLAEQEKQKELERKQQGKDQNQGESPKDKLKARLARTREKQQQEPESPKDGQKDPLKKEKKQKKPYVSPEVMKMFQENIQNAPQYAKSKPGQKPKESPKKVQVQAKTQEQHDDYDEDMVKSPLKKKYISLADEPIPEDDPLNKPFMSFRTDPAHRSRILKQKKKN